MTRSLSATFAVLILMALGLVSWLGTRVALDEREILRHRFRALLEVALGDIRDQIDSHMLGRQRELADWLRNLPAGTEGLRRQAASSPYALSLFVLDGECHRVYPPPRPPWTRGERAFLLRADPLWIALNRLCLQPPVGGAKDGWQSWTWKEPRLAYWQRKAEGGLLGLEINTMRLWAEIIGALPIEGASDGRISLQGPMGETWVSWGKYRPPQGQRPGASLALKPPLEAWRLSYHASAAALSDTSPGLLSLGLTSSLILAGLLMLGLAVFFYRSNLRRLREAAQRVSFVNRVSHELRTPLTNIRMYAEMLGESLPEDQEQAQRRLSVILDETRRLGRLINNVLAFSRQQRNREDLRAEPLVPDRIITASLAQFQPSLDRKAVTCEFEPGAGETVMLDGDALEQILANLLSNVEKYAAEGGLVRLSSRQDQETFVLRVQDRGPGIPARQREKIFEPFERASARLTDKATGTGLGLAISRELARLHGGDLKLLPSEQGACFELRLRTPRPDSAGDRPGALPQDRPTADEGEKGQA